MFTLITNISNVTLLSSPYSPTVTPSTSLDFFLHLGGYHIQPEQPRKENAIQPLYSQHLNNPNGRCTRTTPDLLRRVGFQNLSNHILSINTRVHCITCQPFPRFVYCAFQIFIIRLCFKSAITLSIEAQKPHLQLAPTSNSTSQCVQQQ